MSVADDEKDLDDQQLGEPQLQQLIRTKGKCKTYSKQKEIFVELKPKRRAGKCLGAGHLQMAALPSTMTEEPESYNIIPNEIWLHVAEHIPPEQVGTFALICRQTSDIVHTRRFWMHLYRRYCTASAQNSWQHLLREQQQQDWQSCDWRALRAHVIENLFEYYEPFVTRLKNVGYSLDMLLGSTYVATWTTEQMCSCGGLAIHKFYKGNAQAQKSHKAVDFTHGKEVFCWELLADDSGDTMGQQAAGIGKGSQDIYEGFYLLVMLCGKYGPFPVNIRHEIGGLPAKMVATREKLLSDMNLRDLEFDFADPVSRTITTWTHQKVNHRKVVPWWHPKFRNFMSSW